jgi:tRNA (cmo5U34)-methyltransferase
MIKIMERHPERNLNIKGYDNSMAMIQQAETKGAKVLFADVSEVVGFIPCAFAVSLFTLQFLRIGQRLRTLQRLVKCLDDDGALFLVEKVFSPNPKMHDIFQSLYWDMKSEKGLGADEILNKANSLRGVMRPITVTENVEQLKEAGFNNIDVIFRRELFCGWLCMK